jgi:hypothetical protein
MMGRIQERFRLPLCEIDAGRRAKLEATLRQVGVLP